MMTLKPFSRSEIFAIVLIFLALVGISAPNFVVSLRRARDQVRKDDLGHLVNAVDAYQTDFGTLPLSSPDGKIIACKKPQDVPQIDKNGRLNINLVPCEWGRDKFVDLLPGSNKVYMDLFPDDPQSGMGVKYIYSSDGISYQILASLEGSDEAEYDKAIVARNVMCGSRVCNMGRSYNTPLNMSIQEYKVYLDQLSKLKNAQKKK